MRWLESPRAPGASACRYLPLHRAPGAGRSPLPHDATAGPSDHPNRQRGDALLLHHHVVDCLGRREQTRYKAERVARPKLFDLPGKDRLFCTGKADTVTDRVDEIRPACDPPPDTDRVLATVLFVDVVGSTELAVRLGDRRCRDLLERYYIVLRRALGRLRGREIDTAGDGVLAAFDGPARAVRCSCSILHAVWPLGIEIRAGVHSGERAQLGDKLGGVARES